MLPASEKMIRVNSSSLDHPLTILADQGIEIVGIEKKVMVGRTMRSAYWLTHDPSWLLKVPSMSVDLMLPASEKITLVLEGIGDDKIRVNSSSLDHPVVILADQSLEIVVIAKTLYCTKSRGRPTGSTSTRPA
jgi:hypothetical protein